YGPVVLHNCLLGTSRDHCCFSMVLLFAPDRFDADFHRDTKSRGHLLRPAYCRELCRPASDDSDRVNLCLGSDHRRSARPPPSRAVDRNSQGITGALCLGTSFEGGGRGIDRGASCGRRIRGSITILEACGWAIRPVRGSNFRRATRRTREWRKKSKTPATEELVRYFPVLDLSSNDDYGRSVWPFSLLHFLSLFSFAFLD